LRPKSRQWQGNGTVIKPWSGAVDIGEVSREEAGTSGPVMESALRALLTRRPDALVMAALEDGHFIPVPECLGVASSRVPQGRSAIDLVHADDRIAVIDAWQTTKAMGGARILVRLAGATERTAALHLFDVTSTIGVFVGVLLVNDATDELLDRTVAVKEVSFPRGLPDEEQQRLRRRTLREARTNG